MVDFASVVREIEERVEWLADKALGFSPEHVRVRLVVEAEEDLMLVTVRAYDADALPMVLLAEQTMDKKAWVAALARSAESARSRL